MKNNYPNNYGEHRLPKRVDKALMWMVDSRNKWKEKCLAVKLKLKRLTQDNKRVRDSRDGWRLRNDRLKRELFECKQENTSFQSRIKELESQLTDKNIELDVLKKSR